MNTKWSNILSKSPWDDSDNNSQEENIFTRPRKGFKSPFPNDFKFNMNFSPRLIYLVLAAFAGLWLLSGIYEVKEGEEAVVIRFGKFVRKGSPGLNYRLPLPFEAVIVEKVNQSRRIEIGYRSGVTSRSNNTPPREITVESTMLTGDENIVYLNCDVIWHIKNLENFVFNIVGPEDTVKTAAESAIRDEIGQIPIASVLSNQKQEIADRIEILTQKILDQYNAGVEIDQVQLLKAEPPPAVIDAYRDVQTSKADKEREINKAQAYNNDILPQARGEAAKIMQEAEGYKQRVISTASGDTERFNFVLNQYQKAKSITKDRLQLETMLEVLKDSKKVITSSDVIPHMSIKAK